MRYYAQCMLELYDELVGGGNGARRERLTYHKWYYDPSTKEYLRCERVEIDDVPYRGPHTVEVIQEGDLVGIPPSEVPVLAKQLAAMAVFSSRGLPPSDDEKSR